MSRAPGEPYVRLGAPHALHDYALLADGYRAALIGPRGDISWLCAPVWDSGSVFSSLIGGQGAYGITPRVPYTWGGSYEQGTLVWHTRWVTQAGAVECHEALAYPGEAHRAVLLRRIVAVDCAAQVDVELRPRADYDRHPVRRWTCQDGVWIGRAGGLRLRWTGAAAARPAGGGALHAALDVPAGAHLDLVLEIAAGDDGAPLPSPDALWQSTISAWRADVPALDDVRAAHDARHSLAVLRGMTCAAGTVAAATTSLPERAGGGRNYDYRYVWLRDQCFVGRAAAGCGNDALLDVAMQVVADRLLADGDRTVPAYTLAGEPVPTPRHLDLPGYPGGYDVVGNQVHNQFQLDLFGEALLLFACAERAGQLSSDAWRGAELAAAAIAGRWREPDSGIWEIEARNWTHSRLIAAAGLRAIAAAAPARCPQAPEWVALADHIVAETARNALHPEGWWQRAPELPAPDVALVFAGLRGAVPPGDPRTTATLAECLRELTVDGYAYRFRQDDRPLPDAEGSFLLCGFAIALGLHEQHCEREAVAWFERTRAAQGAAQLFSEEYDPVQRQMRGNLPQSFVHAFMVESCAILPGEDPFASG